MPGVSIEEALNLFLSITYPRGIPEGVDQETLLRQLFEKVAADRPEWAAATAQARQPEAPLHSGLLPSLEQSYMQMKADAIRKAQQGEVPDNPEERYFYEREEEARRNREDRREDGRESRLQQDLLRRVLLKKKTVECEEVVREDMRQRILARTREDDEEFLERTLRIRQVLEERVRPTFQKGDEEKKPSSSKSLTPEESTGPGNSRARKPKGVDKEERIQMLRSFNEARREQLRSRAGLMNPRRPAQSPKISSSLTFEAGDGGDSMCLTMEAEATKRPFEPLKLQSFQRIGQGSSTRVKVGL